MDDFKEEIKAHSFQALKDILAGIDGEKYPERYQAVLEEVQLRWKDPMVVETSGYMMVGFWIRLLSDFLDVLFLGFVSWLPVLLMKDFFYGLGESGGWMGLLMAFLYTGLLQTSLGSGQTLAKKLLRIQVLKLDGTFLSFSESVFRYSVVAFIAFHEVIYRVFASSFFGLFPHLRTAMGIYFQTAYNLWVWFVICGVILMVPFHPLKQGLHDLLAGTVVVRKGLFSREKLVSLQDEKKSKRAYLIASTGFVCAAVLLIFTHLRIIPMAPELRQFMGVIEKVEEATEFRNTEAGLYVWNVKEGNWNSFIVSTYLSKSRFDDKVWLRGEVQKVVSIVVKEVPGIRDYDFIWVQVRSGFDTGLAALNESEGFTFSTEGKEIKDLPIPHSATS